MQASHAIELRLSIDNLNSTFDTYSVNFVNSLKELSDVFSRMTHGGLADYFNKIKKDNRHVHIGYIGVRTDNMGGAHSMRYSGKVADVFGDCVVLSNGEGDTYTETCFPYHAITNVQGFADSGADSEAVVY